MNSLLTRRFAALVEAASGLRFGRLASAALFVAMIVLTARPGQAAPGAADASNPDPNAIVHATAIQTDGKMLIGGDFTTLGVVARNHLARLNANGTLDTGFNPDVNGNVAAIAVQNDGKIIIAGSFTTVGVSSRSRLARLNADGTLDSGFTPTAGSDVAAVLIQPDDKILIAGYFSSVNSTTRNGVARLNVNGSLDGSFNPNANGFVLSMALQSDGKLLLAGSFTTLGGVARGRVARLNVNGTLDSDFNPNAGNSVMGVAVQSDGKVLLTGQFTSLQPNGALAPTARDRIARVNADGTLDSDFEPSASGFINCSALQADGRILLGGAFTAITTTIVTPFGTTIVTTTRNRIARLNSNGSLDTDFDPNASAQIYSLAVGAGKITAGGSFVTIGSASRKFLARLDNDAATESITVPSSSRVRWLRGGGLPEASATTFELSTDGGTNFTLLGAGVRITGGWEMTGLNLPASGYLRVRARVAGGYYNGSAGLMETVTAYTVAPQPQIAVSGNGAGIINGALSPSDSNATTFGAVSTAPGTTAVVRTYTVSNLGTGELTLGSVSVGGTAAADFSVTTQPAPTVAAGASTSFQVSFLAGAAGTRNATLSFANNDESANPFSFAVSGTGLSNNADLSNLTLSAGTLAPGFTSGNLAYSASVSHNFASVTLTPTRAQANATIEVRSNGAAYSAVSSGTPSGALALNVGPNTLEVRVTAQDGLATRIYALSVTRAAVVSGDADLAFAPALDGAVFALAFQPDGKVLIGGRFSTIGGVAHNLVARLNADGSLDSSFNNTLAGAQPVLQVESLALQPDGKVLIGGIFSTVDGVTRAYLARLNANGSLDPGFNADVTDTVSAIVVQPDGKILVGGGFTSLGGVPRNYIARLNSNGTRDSGFNPVPNGAVRSLALDASGRIILAGAFTTVDVSARTAIARLNSDGMLDSGFAPVLTDPASPVLLCSLVQRDGKILIGGRFSTVNGLARSRFARLNANGSTDSDFTADVTSGSFPQATAQQVDGKILVAGTFTAINGIGRNRIASLNSDGSVDSFNPDVESEVACLGIQADGKVIAGGSFGTVGGISRPSLVRLENGPASQLLSVPSHGQVTWTRAGTSPELSRVDFELSVDSGMNWVALGSGTRVGSTADWQLAGLALPAAGRLRARGATVGIIEAVIDFAFAPDIALSGNGVDISAGDSSPSSADHTDFGDLALSGATLTRTYTIANSGNDDLSLGAGAILLTGAHAADFTLGGITLPATVPPGGTITFTVTFDPSANGLRSAGLAISSNDPDESPFSFAIQGISLTALERWRLTHFASVANSGNGANDADPDTDGISNLVEYALGLDPNAVTALPVSIAVNGSSLVFTYTRSKTALQDGVTFQVEAVGALGSTWTTAGLSAEEILSDNGSFQTVKVTTPVSGGQRFLHLAVSVP